MGRVEIRVCGARNIGDVQKVGTPDPYVKVKVSTDPKNVHKFKTRVVSNSLNPVWDEVYKFQVADHNTAQVIFEVWNDNVMVDDLLGLYPLSLNGLRRGVLEDMWCILTGAKLASAEIHLRVLAVDFGRDAAPGEHVFPSIEAAEAAMGLATTNSTGISDPVKPSSATSGGYVNPQTQDSVVGIPIAQQPQLQQQQQQPQVVYVQAPPPPQIVYQVPQPQVMYQQPVYAPPQPQMMYQQPMYAQPPPPQQQMYYAPPPPQPMYPPAPQGYPPQGYYR